MITLLLAVIIWVIISLIKALVIPKVDVPTQLDESLFNTPTDLKMVNILFFIDIDIDSFKPNDE